MQALKLCCIKILHFSTKGVSWHRLTCIMAVKQWCSCVCVCLVMSCYNCVQLKVREHPRFGPYVEGLSAHVVTSYDDISSWLSVGSKRRATAATSINDTSSRSHSVFSLLLTKTTVSYLFTVFLLLVWTGKLFIDVSYSKCPIYAALRWEQLCQHASHLRWPTGLTSEWLLLDTAETEEADFWEVMLVTWHVVVQ